jgi:nitrous oxide reductase accessory protein NosL
MRRPERRPSWLWLAAFLVAAGCAPAKGPPPIAAGAPCAACGMAVRDLRFACERKHDRGWRVYDAIECLIRDAGGAGGAAAVAAIPEAWLADYDTQRLHPADSLWVVRGEFASPMGGGFAAFADRAAADSVAALTRGRVERFAAFVREGAGAVR